MGYDVGGRLREHLVDAQDGDGDAGAHLVPDLDDNNRHTNGGEAGARFHAQQGDRAVGSVEQR